MSWKKTASFKSCFSTVCFSKKYNGFKKNICIFAWPTKREKKRSAMQPLFVHTRGTLGGRWNWPVKQVPVGTFRKHWRHNFSFNPISRRPVYAVGLSFKSYGFYINSSYTCGKTKTMRKHYVWTRIPVENRGKYLRFQTNVDTCGRGQQSVKGTCASVCYLATNAL